MIGMEFLLNLCRHQRILWEESDPSYTNRNKEGMVVVAFSSLARILGECSTIHPLTVLFLGFFFLVFEVEISSLTLFPLFKPGSVHTGSAS